MGSVEHLDRFENHFDDVFVGVPAGRQFGVCVKNKDIHLGGGGTLVERAATSIFIRL